MTKENNKIDRRNFLKTLGAAGVGSVLAAASIKAEPNDAGKAEPNNTGKTDPNAQTEPQQPQYPKIPKRTLGKTNLQVPVLALGTMFNVIENQLVLNKSLDWGVTYWDTADCYAGGKSETGIGNFIAKNPDIRKELFIVTKSDARDPGGMQKLLARSLQRMNTDYIDMYFIHGTGESSELTDEMRRWVEKAKEEKKIKSFGFSTHSNMAMCLNAAAKLGWIDAIMTSYNFRLMQNKEMNDAVEACYQAGIGLVAMKVQARGQNIETDADRKLTEHFLQTGFTEGQAKIKAVLEDKRIASACLSMTSIALLTSNVAAVLDKTKLSQADKQIFTDYAQTTCNGYCAGCAEICSAASNTPYISEVMRYLMYHNGYGEKAMAKELFAQIPAQVRNRLLSVDYSIAEARCPQKLPIARLMAEAVSALS